MLINDKVAVVTGAASGIGMAVCEELIARGALAVAMVDMSDTVFEVADRLNENSPKQKILECLATYLPGQLQLALHPEDGEVRPEAVLHAHVQEQEEREDQADHRLLVRECAPAGGGLALDAVGGGLVGVAVAVVVGPRMLAPVI